MSLKPQLRKTSTTIRGIWESRVLVWNIVLPVFHKGRKFEIECQAVDSNAKFAVCI